MSAQDAGALMASQSVATLPSALICARPGCGRPLPQTRRHGSPRRFCSARCRSLAWDAAHPRAHADAADLADGVREDLDALRLAVASPDLSEAERRVLEWERAELEAMAATIRAGAL